MRRPPARDEGEMLGAPAGQGFWRRHCGDPAAGAEGTREGPLPQRSSPLPRGPTVLSPPVRGHDVAPAVAPPRSTCEQHLPFAEGKSRRNRSNFSRPSQVEEIKSQVTVS